jgi:hypothetical protein
VMVEPHSGSSRKIIYAICKDRHIIDYDIMRAKINTVTFPGLIPLFVPFFKPAQRPCHFSFQGESLDKLESKIA